MAGWKKLQSLVKTKEFFDLVPGRYVFTPNKEEVIESRLRLRYSSTCDSYYRDWSNTIDPSSTSVLPSWERGLFSLDNVYRRIDEDTGLVYIARKDNTAIGNLKWQFNIGCCGLLVDQISLKVNMVADFGGEITVTLIGDAGKQRVKYHGEGDHVTFDGLANSSQVTLSIHLVGEPDQVTRLFPQCIMKGMDYPLDIQFILKPPLESLGKPRILLGLMYSNAQQIQVDARHYKENQSNSTGKGFLHVHFLKAKDLPSAKNGIPESVLKCFCLPDARKTTKCRTKPKQSKDPIWDEQFLIVNLSYHDVKRMSLEVCLTEYHMTPVRKVRVFGGLRLSLGKEKITAAQTKNVSQVLKAFLGKRQTEDDESVPSMIGVSQTGIASKARGVNKIGGNPLLAHVLQHKAKEEEKRHTEDDTSTPGKTGVDQRGIAPKARGINKIGGNPFLAQVLQLKAKEEEKQAEIDKENSLNADSVISIAGESSKGTAGENEHPRVSEDQEERVNSVVCSETAIEVSSIFCTTTGKATSDTSLTQSVQDCESDKMQSCSTPSTVEYDLYKESALRGEHRDSEDIINSSAFVNEMEYKEREEKSMEHVNKAEGGNLQLFIKGSRDSYSEQREKAAEHSNGIEVGDPQFKEERLEYWAVQRELSKEMNNNATEAVGIEPDQHCLEHGTLNTDQNRLDDKNCNTDCRQETAVRFDIISIFSDKSHGHHHDHAMNSNNRSSYGSGNKKTERQYDDDSLHANGTGLKASLGNQMHDDNDTTMEQNKIIEKDVPLELPNKTIESENDNSVESDSFKLSSSQTDTGKLLQDNTHQQGVVTPERSGQLWTQIGKNKTDKSNEKEISKDDTSKTEGDLRIGNIKINGHLKMIETNKRPIQDQEEPQNTKNLTILRHENSSKSLPSSPFKTKTEKANEIVIRNDAQSIKKSGSESSNLNRRNSARLSKSFSRTLSIRKSLRESREEREKKKETLRKELNEIMLDASGLEIKQWEMVIEKPKQWIFCWQLLRDLKPIHHKL